MSAEHFKKAYSYFSNRCSKKELSTREVMVGLQKYQLKLSEKHKLINKLKKEKYIDHDRYAKAFTNDRFNFYKWGKLKIKQQPSYNNSNTLKLVEEKINKLPPLIFAGEVRSLKNKLEKVSLGEAFLLQGGDCAESFSDFSANNLRDSF